VTRSGSRQTFAGPAEWFTGTVNVEMLFVAPEPANVSGGLVSFLPGARTDWHAHPLGQTLVVTAGCGRVQQWGGPVQEIRPGDVVTIPAGVKHWHGAAPDTAMSHIAIQQSLDGQNSEWMEKVGEDQYPR
jgi:quercetin dioxygenase-like cupin family protein